MKESNGLMMELVKKTNISPGDRNREINQLVNKCQALPTNRKWYMSIAEECVTTQGILLQTPAIQFDR